MINDETFYVVIPGEGLQLADSEKDAKGWVETALEAMREEALLDGEWDPDTKTLQWGKLVPLGRAIEAMSPGRIVDYEVRSMEASKL